MTEIVLNNAELSSVWKCLSDDWVESFIQNFVDGASDYNESDMIERCKILSCLILEKRLTDVYILKVMDKSLSILGSNPSNQICILVELCYNAVPHRAEAFSRIFDVTKGLLEEDKDSRMFNCGVALCHHICSSYIDEGCNEALTSFVTDACFRFNLGHLNRLMLPLESLVRVQIDENFLRDLWKRLEWNHRTEKDDCLIRALTILCSLGRHYVASGTNCHSLMQESGFWRIVQEGLASSKSVARKQSLYLIKLSIVALESTESAVLPTFKWNQSDGLEALSSLCLASEVAEECQPHMVMPIFKILDHLAHVCGTGIVCSSWLFPIYTRLFRHESFIISRTAIISFCSAPAHCFADESFNYQPILVEFFTACNNMLLFDSSNNQNCVEDLLTQWFSLLPSSAFSHFLPSMIQTHWGPIPLYHVIHSLFQSNRQSLWTNETLLELKHFVKSFLVSQNVMIRGAIQFTTLRCLFNLATASLDLNIIAQLLSTFPSNESFKRGSPVWSECAQWLKSVVGKQADAYVSNLTEELKDPTTKNISPSVTARMMALLWDAHPTSKTARLVEILFSQFDCCDKRLYSSYKNQMFCVRFLNCLIGETRVEFPIEDSLLEIIANACPVYELCSFVTRRFKVELTCAASDSILPDIDEVLSLYENVCWIVSLHERLPIMRKFRQKFYEKLLPSDVFLVEKENPFELYFKLGIIEITLKYWPGQFQKLLFEKLTTSLDPQNDPQVCDTSQSNAVAKSHQKAWSSRYLLIHTRKVAWLSHPNLPGQAMTAISVGGKEAIVYVLQVLSVALPLFKDDETIVECLNQAWSACFENRKSELFWKAMRWWIVTAFQPSLMERIELNDYLKQKALELIHLGSDVIGMANLLVSELIKCSAIANLIDYVDVIVECLLFGPLLRRDQRIEDDTCELIRSRFGNDSVQDARQKQKKSSEVRARALGIVLFSKNDKFKIALVESLVELDRQLAKENKKYFNDSEIHRRRNRLWQSLILLEHDLQDDKSSKILFDWLSDSLLNYSHQPSVRYLMEWLFVRMCLWRGFMEQFWAFFETSSLKPGPQCSFISIGFHLCRSSPKDNFFETFLENLLPCCMSQNFNVRLYSQVTLQKLWDLFPVVAEKYDVIRKNQHKVFEQGNALVNAQKMENEFYFKCFDPVKHYTLKTIFWDIPRLSNLAKDEWISCNELQLYGVQGDSPVGISLGEGDTSLDEFTAASWIPRTIDNDSNNSPASAIQKKYMPTKGLELQNVVVSPGGPEKKVGHLVLVTSLLDKPTNLGGLARTSDIFGVHQFIVGSLQSVTDKNFTSLSMTAESHLDIREVKPFKLKEYFKVMKGQGYFLVGAEQTTESVPLSQFTFPYNTVLLLGNEREGIPADLLSTLDSFVEIPQFGVIRSLNVHVTGAILMWEYAKQHFRFNCNG